MMLLLLAALAHALDPMVVQVVERTSGTPVPCVTLTSVHQVRWSTDVNGLALILEPGLVGQTLWLTVDAEGFEVPPDWLGFEGTSIDVTEGGFARIEVDRAGPLGPCTPGDEASQWLQSGLPDPPMRVEVRDAATGRGVPLALVRAGEASWWTDSAGNVAILDPDLYGTEVVFEVAEVHGYGPGTSASALVEEGGHVVIDVPRALPAERLYRLTGADPYRDTELLGLSAPTPALRGRVVGQDSALTIDVGGRRLWMWGDTLKPDYPLGHFDTAAAWVDPAAADPAETVVLDYIVGPDGFSRGVADLSGDPVWLTAPAVVDDVVVAMYGVYSGLVATERGLAVFDESTERFDPLAPLPLALDLGHQVPVNEHGWVVHREGVRYPATLEGVLDPDRWEVWAPDEGTWAWRPGWEPTEEKWAETRDAATGELITLHNGSIARSEGRHRFAHVFTREGGDGAWLGELWYSEADTPIGPWSWAVPVARHDDYTVYNPMLHPELSDERFLYFQGTYTTFFASAPEPTPRYDYNQLMYRLDLDDVAVPVPVYEAGGEWVTGPYLDTAGTVAFHAFDRPVAGAVAVGYTGPSCGDHDLRAGDAVIDPRFWVWPTPGPALVPFADPEPLGYVWPAGPADVPAHDWRPPEAFSLGPDRCVTEDAPGAGHHLVLDELDMVLTPGIHALEVTRGTFTDRLLVEVVALPPEPADTADPPAARRCGCESASVSRVLPLLGLVARRE